MQMEKPQSLAAAQLFADEIITREKQSFLRHKSGAVQYLEYGEFETLCARLLAQWCQVMQVDTTPKELELACCYAKAALAPDFRTRVRLLKKACGLASGLAGVAAVISAVGLALGWGASVTTIVINFFLGVNFIPVIGWGVAGAGLLVVASYFALKSDNPYEVSLKAEQALRKGVKSAIEKIWQKNNK